MLETSELLSKFWCDDMSSAKKKDMLKLHQKD